VAGGEHSRQQVKAGDEVRPELRKFVEPVHRRSCSTEARRQASLANRPEIKFFVPAFFCC
jgi:hypothetical protein